jgi:hypothetical protein
VAETRVILGSLQPATFKRSGSGYSKPIQRRQSTKDDRDSKIFQMVEYQTVSRHIYGTLSSKERHIAEVAGKMAQDYRVVPANSLHVFGQA